MSLFESEKERLKIKTPIRLIELFAGVGSQAMALRDIGADFTHHRVVEFDKYCIKSYNAIHGTDFEPMDIREVKGEDLGIEDTDKYTYIMTYSFPCQDLSVAGRGAGMKRDSGTRSGLLWEVERLLLECEQLPQILLMENVVQVHSKSSKNGHSNLDDFNEWIEFLSRRGYTSWWADLNAKDYGVAQNRKRTFMVSALGENLEYKFPTAVPLVKTMNDYLEPVVDEKYYIKNDNASRMLLELVESGRLEGVKNAE